MYWVGGLQSCSTSSTPLQLYLDLFTLWASVLLVGGSLVVSPFAQHCRISPALGLSTAWSQITTWHCRSISIRLTVFLSRQSLTHLHAQFFIQFQVMIWLGMATYGLIYLYNLSLCSTGILYVQQKTITPWQRQFKSLCWNFGPWSLGPSLKTALKANTDKINKLSSFIARYNRKKHTPVHWAQLHIWIITHLLTLHGTRLQFVSVETITHCSSSGLC